MTQREQLFSSVRASEPLSGPPQWAILQRALIDAMNEAVEPLVENYLRADGSLMWPPSPDFQSIDALDDAYESFHNWPLFYMLGGDESFLTRAEEQFETITRTMARHQTGRGYPMVVNEYQPGYDWFHQGEGNYLFYMLCAANPSHPKHRERARRFAGLYMNEDPNADNYDPVHKIVKCAHNGSLGPAHGNFAGEYAWTAPGYGLHFYDIPGVETVEDLNDPVKSRRYGIEANARRAQGDAVVNLAATSLAANAYLLTGDEKCKAWAVEYIDAWRERAERNGGILPDNVGMTGKIGEHMNGAWYGANYGWTWPHGWHGVGEAAVIAGQNGALLERDLQYLDLPRSQIDVLIENGIEREGQLYTPFKHGTPGRVRYVPWPFLNALRNEDGTALERNGWFEFMPMHPLYIAHVWNGSLSEEDMGRFETLRRSGAGANMNEPAWHHIKDQGGHDGAWLAFLRGEFPDYPEQILQHNLNQVYARLAFMQSDDDDPAHYGDSYFQRRNTVTCEGLVQLTMGAPLPIYNGGLLFANAVHHDAQRKRPGLPPDAAALVEELGHEKMTIRLVNLSPSQARESLIQAGAFREHRIVSARCGEQEIEVGGAHLHVHLPPAAQARIEMKIDRYANDPSYGTPWGND